MASDGDYGPTRTEIRNICNLSATDISDSVLDDLLKEAFYAVQDACKVTFTTSAKDFKNVNTDQQDYGSSVTSVRFEVDSTGLIINGRDLFQGEHGTTVFLKDFGNFGEIQTITGLDYRSDDNDSWEAQDAGSDQDYDVDYSGTSIPLNFKVDYYGSIRIAGTYGVVVSAMTNLPFKYKQLIALIAARSAVAYSSGGGWDDIKSYSVGEVSTSYGEFAPNWRGQIERLDKRIQAHVNHYGLSLEKEACDVC